MNSFSVHSRQQDERHIVREQRDFSDGMYRNIPGVQIPDNGVAYLRNVKNYGGYLEGRKGSALWGSSSTRSSLTESGDVWAAHFHKFKEKVIILVNNDIYVSSDPELTSWTKAYCESYQKPHTSDSIFDEINNDVILFNANGIYKINLESDTNYFYYKINSDIPQNTISTEDDTSYNYHYRYIVSMGKISGNLVGDDGGYYGSYNRDRTYSGIILRTESGTNTPVSGAIDYHVHQTSGALCNPDQSGWQDGTISGLEIPTISGSANRERHWDIYSIYRTKNIGASGYDPITGQGNDPTLYVWTDDIPVSKALYGRIVQMLPPYSRCFEIASGASDYADRGSSLYIWSGGSGFSPLTIDTISNNLYLIDDVIPAEPIGDYVPAFIGATSGGFLNVSGNVVYSISGNNFTSDDIGRRITLCNGEYLHISGVSGTSGLIVEDSEYDGIVGCWGEGSRNFCDVISDEELESRISSYPCEQRFFKNLPDCNLGTISPSFVFAAEKNENGIHYSQIPYGYEYMVGYYHPLYQYTFVKDGIRHLDKTPEHVVVYSRNSTTTIPLNVTNTVDLEEYGVSISVIGGQIEADTKIGVTYGKSVQSLENGSHIVVTNEPAIRVFDGVSYGQDKTFPYFGYPLKYNKSNLVTSYHPTNGYTMWLTRPSGSTGEYECYNLGLGDLTKNARQGIGFSIVDGDYPEPECQFNIVDSNGYSKTIVLDVTDDVFFDITPITTNAIISENDYKDKFDFSSGNIETEIIFKTDKAESEDYIMEHYKSSFYIDSPFSPLPETQQTYDYEDPDRTFTVTTYGEKLYWSSGYYPLIDKAFQYKQITGLHKLNSVVYNKAVEGNRMYTSIVGNTGFYRLYGRRQEYIAKDINYYRIADDIGHYDYQENVSDVSMWFTSKSLLPLYDRVSGQIMSGAVYYENDGIWTDPIYGLIEDTRMTAEYPTTTEVILPNISYEGDKTIAVLKKTTPVDFYINDIEVTRSVESFEAGDGWHIYFASGVSGSGQIKLDFAYGFYYFIEIRVFNNNTASGAFQYWIDDIFYNGGLNTQPLD